MLADRKTSMGKMEYFRSMILEKVDYNITLFIIR